MLNTGGASCTSLLDDQLIEFVKNGTVEAFEELYRRHRKRLYKIAMRITKNSEDSEDAVQDTFLNALRHLETFGGRSSFSTWITSILINTCLVQLRKKRSRPCVSLDESRADGISLGESAVDQSVDIEGDYANKQQLKWLSESISALSPKLRAIVETYRLHDCSMTEVAKHHRISVAAAKSRMLRARTILATQARG